jgi:hypothetical protein
LEAKHEFVTNDRIWQHINAALQAGRPARIAVPFIGLGASQWIKPAGGSWVVTRCDLKSAQAGQVSGKDLLAWRKRSVRIFNLQALHAKVFAFGRSAFIGSSNASVTSRDRLVEAGVWTTAKALAESAWAFVEEHCNEEVDEEFLRELAGAYRPPTQYPMQGEGSASRGKGATARQALREQDEAPLHLIRLYTASWNEAQQAAANRAESSGRKRLNQNFKAEVNTFTWPGAPGRFAVGDLILARMTNKADGLETVQPWSRVIGLHKVRGKNQHAVATATLPAWREMELPDFAKAAGGLMENFIKSGGRSRTATTEERATILRLWRHRQAKLVSDADKGSGS